LFALLDALRTHPAVWIAAPPGAGKTTLVASWLEAQQRTAIWYQIDPTDNDPATFFCYLSAAAQPVKRKGAALPLLTAELAHDIASFARRYFRALFARLEPNGIVVFDNLHELSQDSSLYLMLAQAAEETTTGAQFILISRGQAAGAFIRLKANKILGTVRGEELKFTLAETKAMAQGVGALGTQEAQGLYERCDGWASGLTSLLMERKRLGEPLEAVDDRLSLEDVFNYFATEIVERLYVSAQDTLLKLAALSYLTPEMAVRVSGDEHAGGLIDHLCRHNLSLVRAGTGRRRAPRGPGGFGTGLRPGHGA